MDRVNYSPLYEIYTDRQNDEGVIARSESSIMRLRHDADTARGKVWRFRTARCGDARLSVPPVSYARFGAC